VKKPLYETMVIVDALIPDEAIESEFEAIGKQIEQRGELIKLDRWGRRKLAYKINGRTHGDYGVFYYHAPASLPNELAKHFRINENILRWLSVKDNPAGLPSDRPHDTVTEVSEEIKSIEE